MIHQSQALGFLTFISVSVLGASSDAAIEIAKWEVSSTSVVDGQDSGGNPAPHGLWTGDSDFVPPPGGNYFDMQAGSLLTQFDDGTATLVGTAVNPYGVTALIDLLLEGFTTSLPNPATEYHQEQGSAYNAAEQDFYASTAGTISFEDDLGDPLGAVTIDSMVSPHYFQFGLGANSKSPTEFGASAWIQSSNNVPVDYRMESHHWDLNLTLTRVPDEEGGPDVPEPVSFAVWSLLGALGAAGCQRRRAV